MRNPWPSRIAYAAVVASVVAAAWWALRERPVKVDIATITEGPMRVTVREEGMTRVRDVYVVSTPIAGHLARTLLEEGDRVMRGETVIASIHPPDPPFIDARAQAELLASRDAARSAVAIAESELRRTSSELDLAREDLERSLKLAETGVISESSLQRTSSAARVLEEAVKAATETIDVRRAELAAAEARLAAPSLMEPGGNRCCVDLRAPADGAVLAVHVRSEQTVGAGAPIADIGDTARLEIVVDLLSADAVRLAPGKLAIVKEWGGDSDLKARLRKIDPAAFTKVSALGIEEQRVNAVLDLVESDPRLGHQFRVVVELPVWECDRCLTVPISAIFRSGSDWQVFRIDGERVEMVSIEIGRMNDEQAQLLSGLKPGDLVVLHPSDTLQTGSLVTYDR